MNAVLEHPVLRHQVMPMTVPTYQALGQRGLIDEPAELIRGFVLRKTAKSPRHRIVTQRLIRLLRSLLTAGCSLWQEQPITCADSEPEPDVALVKGNEEDFAHAHPTTAALIIEVAVSSLERDREKASIYAEAGVTEYWLVNPEQNRVEVYTQPSPAGYQKKLVLGMADTLLASEFPEISVVIADLLR